MGDSRKKNVCVVVLGDIGRSPRMKYHSMCLANSGYNVDIIGYAETQLDSSLTSHTNIHIHPLVSYPKLNIPKLIDYVFKTMWQALTLLCALTFKKADFVLVQNPPAIPTLTVCWFYCLWTKAKFVIDWHNYAHTIMALKLSKKHILVKSTKWVESFFGKKADINFCVTHAMRDDLKTRWNIIAHTLYDKPSEAFKKITLQEKHELFLNLAGKYSEFKDEHDLNNTIFTERKADEIIFKNNRPALLISSTSWTEDEDFSILLNALEIYEESIENGNPLNLPKLFCVITGKGPLKEFYICLINRKKMKNVKIVTPWLETEDYPKMLASADLGVCLHTSSSGLDLPMKVVDMFGCCLPVCAYDFKCLNELVKHEENSYIFKDSQELASLLQKWFDNFPKNKTQQETEAKFKNDLYSFQKVSWEENWKLNASEKFQ